MRASREPTKSKALLSRRCRLFIPSLMVGFICILCVILSVLSVGFAYIYIQCVLLNNVS